MASDFQKKMNALKYLSYADVDEQGWFKPEKYEVIYVIHALFGNA